MTGGMKRCTKCGQDKQLSGFSRCKASKDGYGYECKECSVERLREWKKTPKGLSYERHRGDRAEKFWASQAAGERAEAMKCCKACKQDKLLTAFYKSRVSPDGYTARCKKCRDAASGGYKKTPNGKIRAFYAQKKFCYGVSAEQLDMLMQEKTCEICGHVFSNVKKGGPHIDHDHKTGIVRGVLCTCCNSLLGYAKENIIVLKKTIAYLEGRRKYNIVPIKAGKARLTNSPRKKQDNTEETRTV